jgi:hypothetical protein
VLLAVGIDQIMAEGADVHVSASYFVKQGCIE